MVTWMGWMISCKAICQYRNRRSPISPYTRVGDRRYLFDAWFPLSDLADPPCGRRARPLHLIFGTLMDMGITSDMPCFEKILEKFVSEGLIEGQWLKTKSE
jgi:hypothetical protein